MRITALAAAVSLTLPLLTTAPAFSQNVSTEEFVDMAAVSGLFEIESGRLATDKAKGNDVKEFGEQMVEDHSETSDELKELVIDEHINAELPTALDEEHQAKLDQLKEVSGIEFDKVYIPMQVLAHEKAVNLFQDYAKSGENEDLKEWADDTLPTLEEHLEEARQLNKALSAPPATAGKPEKSTDKTAQQTGQEKGARTVDFDYVKRQQPTDWSAQALIGRNIENSEGETLGEINNLIINEKGRVVAITIGVGGFLGLGEKDVGVPFDALKFQAATETGEGPAKQETAEEAGRFDSEHADVEIVLNATRDQLENAPGFLWLDEQDDKRAEAETEAVE